MAFSQTSIQGVVYSSANVEVSIEGVGTLNKVQSINWGYSKELTKINALGSVNNVGRTIGQKTVDDVSMEISISDYMNWEANAGSLDDFMDSVFDITINYRLEGQPLQTKVLKDCTPINVAPAVSVGADQLVCPLTFSCMEIS